MNKLIVAVVFGGCSNEYSVSLQSAAYIVEQIDRTLYDVVMVGITKEGHWLTYRGDTDSIRQDSWHQHPSCLPAFIAPSREIGGIVELVQTEYRTIKVDVVFPALHGKYGEDGTVQGLLQLAGIPYVGCDSFASVLAMDKVVAHTIVQACGITVPNSMTVYDGDRISEVIAAATDLTFPLFVKPVKSGSSIGITKVNEISQLEESIALAFTHDNKVTIEENIVGFEVGCAMLGYDDPKIGVLDEIEISTDFFDFTEKYQLLHSAIHVPARINEAVAERVKEQARTIYKHLGLSGLARIDFFITPDLQVVFNEVNTMPGFTEHSRYPKMMQASGINARACIQYLIQTAVQGGVQ
ncbi:D-alanine--D-serine ligase VanG [Paenibacillus yanchengensis]|uniref:D-alanine--D-alanine ligase n=1 Tax=Paenibacillus yanchengensis TaxID=2035833 RepID=A0ABW4YKN2_9BACL